MSNSFSQLINNHRSIRNFKNIKVDPEIIKEAVEDGIKSSSSGNMQSWSVIASYDEKTRDELYEIHLEQEMIKSASCVLTFCADFNRMNKWLELRDAKASFDDLSGFLVGAFDAIIASQTVALSLESKGLGICYMGTTLWEPKKISDLLNLPNLVIPVTSLVVGYPDEVPAVRDRLSIDSILHFEKYHDHSMREIEEIYKDREVKGWARYMSNSSVEEKAELEKAGITNLAQFYTSEFKYSKEFFGKKAQEYFEELKRKGYWNF